MRSLPTTPRARRAFAIAGVALAVAVAWWMTGSAPEPVDVEARGVAVPLVLGAGADRALTAAAASLEAERFATAERQFTDIVAADPESVAGQTGLVLSRWRTLGPAAVERDLEQLAREYPESPIPPLHQGIVRLLRRDAAGAQASLTTARSLARRAGEFDLARRADDLLHPKLPPGYPPVLVRASQVHDRGERATVVRVLAAVRDGDRVLASRLVADHHLADSADLVVRVAAAFARYSKDDPAASLRIVPETHAIQSTTPDRLAMVELHRGLLLLWNSDKSAGLAAIDRAARLAPSSRWAEQARSLTRKLDPDADAGTNPHSATRS